MTERCVRSLFSVLSAFSAFAAPAAAQSIRASGRIITADSTPVSGVRVVLHRVGRAEQGPLDSTSSDRQGRFRLTFRNDTTALYLLSARYRGIEYFSQPVHTNPERPDTAIRITVADTSSTAPVSLAARHVVVTRPGEDGSRSVLDLLVLQNQGITTRVAPDSLRPSWTAPLPPGTLGLELGEGDFSPEALIRRGDSLILLAPLAPGEKQITVQYVVPSSRATLELPFEDSVASVNVLMEERDARVAGGTLVLADSQLIQGRAFTRWTGTVPAKGTLRVTLPGIRRTPPWVLVLLVGALVLALAATAWHRLRGRPGSVSNPSPEELVQAIAALDAKYVERERETPAAEWSSYQAERGRLKAQLVASLAARRSSP